MALIYDQAEENRLVAEREKHENLRAEAAKRCEDMQATDGTWDAPEHLAYRQHVEVHDWHDKKVRGLDTAIERMQTIKPMQPKESKKRNEVSALGRWVRNGRKGLEAYELKSQDDIVQNSVKTGFSMQAESDDYFVSTGMFNEKAFRGTPQNAVLVSDDASPGQDADIGANVVDDEVAPQVLLGLHAYGGLLDGVSITRTMHGNDIKYPTYDETANATRRANQATAVAAQDIQAFKEVTLKAFPYDTGFVDLSRYAEEDVSWDIGMFIENLMRRRMGRALEDAILNGNGGVNAPDGILNYAQEKVVTTADTLSWPDLVDLMTTVDSAYIGGETGMWGYAGRPGMTGWCTSYEFQGKLMQLKDDDNRYIWIPSIRTGAPSILAGHPVYLCHSFSTANKTLAANDATPILFGNLGYVGARFSGPGLVIEKYRDATTALQNYDRYLGRLRFDCRYVGYRAANTGNNAPAIAVLKNKA